jgi:BarA-like signal transduction histidine kinase
MLNEDFAANTQCLHKLTQAYVETMSQQLVMELLSNQVLRNSLSTAISQTSSLGYDICALHFAMCYARLLRSHQPKVCWTSEHMSDLIRPQQVTNLTVLPGSTMACLVGNHQSEHFS